MNMLRTCKTGYGFGATLSMLGLLVPQPDAIPLPVTYPSDNNAMAFTYLLLFKEEKIMLRFFLK